MLRLLQVIFRQVPTGICLFCALLPKVHADPQNTADLLPPQFLSDQVPDQDEGSAILAHFRQLGIAGDYFLSFQLEVLPRRGARHTVPGAMWGTRMGNSPTFRAEIARSDTNQHARLLSRNGPEAQAWRVLGQGPVEKVDERQALESLAGTGISVFDLQMPFLYWPRHVYEGTTTVRGRSAHAFLVYPTPEFATAHPDIAGVRLYLDAKFHALMQAVFLNSDGEPHRKMTVLDLKKLGGRWIVKTIEVRDEESRNKVRFEVKGAALGLDLSNALFTPEMLEQSVAPPDQVEPLRW